VGAGKILTIRPRHVQYAVQEVPEWKP
jgi:hypothetical protein